VQRQARLYVGLIKARQQSVRKVRLKVSVQILKLISGVDELVETVAAVIVLVGIHDLHNVLTNQQQTERDVQLFAMPPRFSSRLASYIMSVHLQLANDMTGEIQKQLGLGRLLSQRRLQLLLVDVKRGSALAIVGRRSFGQLETQRVRSVAHKRRTTQRLCVGQEAVARAMITNLDDVNTMSFYKFVRI
jgi:hypothetical protein